MAWLLSSIVGSSKPTLPFTLGEAHGGDAWGAWTHCRGTSKARGVGRQRRGAPRLTRVAVPVQDSPPVDVSVFKITGMSASDPKLVAARNGVKRLRTVRTRPRPPAAYSSQRRVVRCSRAAECASGRATQLRHPHVLQFKDSVEVEGDKGGAVTLYLVTEPVQPLSTVLQELRLEGSQRCAL